MAKYSMLSTIDNPYSPDTEFDEWFKFDSLKGYNCCGYIARIAKTSDSLPENVNQAEVERAIDWIVANDPTKMYVKLVFDE